MLNQKIKEVAKNYAINNFGFKNGTEQFYESASEQSFYAGVKYAQKWIPIEIEMPTSENGYIDRIVLIKSKNGQIIETAKYSSTQNRWLYSSIASRNPSYWRPIDFL